MPSSTAPTLFDLWAPPFSWGHWVSSPFFFGGGTKKIKINMGTISDAPSSFDIEIKYIDKNGKQVVRREVVSGSGSIEIEAGGENDIHQVHVRVRSHSVGQIIRGDFDLGLTPIPKRSDSMEPSRRNEAIGESTLSLDRSVLGSAQSLANWPATFADQTQMTPAAALRAIEMAKADDAFGKRYVNGDRDAVDYLHALHRAAYPEPEATVGPRVRPDLVDATDDLLTRGGGMTPARRALEAAKSDNGFVTRYLDGDRDAFAHMQSLIRAAYPEPEAPEADRAGTGAAAPMFEPWSPPDMGEGGGAAGWMPDWRGRISRGSGG